ncbi:hypothetical protein ON010_g9379 [Phytophthora cinnamomi]|nr:hypothetical protein ON010_g9379 [Phytophthora cinnamomi]
METYTVLYDEVPPAKRQRPSPITRSAPAPTPPKLPATTPAKAPATTSAPVLTPAKFPTRTAARFLACDDDGGYWYCGGIDQGLLNSDSVDLN